MPLDFRIKLFTISLLNFAICFVWQKFVLENLIRCKVMPALKQRFKLKSSKKFNQIREEIGECDWPFCEMSNGNRDQVEQLEDSKDDTTTDEMEKKRT